MREDATLRSQPPSEGRLDSWKEIAAYLHRDVATAQRWEKREGMPVHRHLHQKIGSVYASRAELDEWMRGRSPRSAQATENLTQAPPTPSPPRLTKVAALTSWKFLVPLITVAAAVAIWVILWLRQTERFWQNPIAAVQFQTVTDFDGVEQAAAVSRDGQFVAFLSDHEGQMDVWVTQIGSGQFHNLTRGSMRDLVNPLVRTLGFSPNGSLVTFWAREGSSSGGSGISVWAVPTLGGKPKVYLEGVAEYAWSNDRSQLTYHTPGPGDPLYVSDGSVRPRAPIFTSPAGLHGHFPIWSPDASFIYFVQGSPPDKFDIWRIRPREGSQPEQITSHRGLVSHPVLLNARTLMYLASDSDGSGPWLYSMDIERRIAHRLSSGAERYTSLAANADVNRLVVTLAIPSRTLWRMGRDGSAGEFARPVQIPLNTRAGLAPRLGPNYLLYVSPSGAGESIWKTTNGSSAELWNGRGVKIFGGPAISADGHQIAFSVQQQTRKLLYIMQANGTGARILSDSLDLEGAPAWAPDGQSLTTAARERGIPRLFRIPLNGRQAVPLVEEYSTDPAWASTGRFVLYSGADVGTTFPVKAVMANGATSSLRSFVLTRGARHLAVINEGRELVFLKGDIDHKNLWMVDLESGVERQLTNLPSDFSIRDFGISQDGREVVLERVQEHSNVALLDLPKR